MCPLALLYISGAYARGTSVQYQVVVAELYLAPKDRRWDHLPPISQGLTKNWVGVPTVAVENIAIKEYGAEQAKMRRVGGYAHDAHDRRQGDAGQIERGPLPYLSEPYSGLSYLAYK